MFGSLFFVVVFEALTSCAIILLRKSKLVALLCVVAEFVMWLFLTGPCIQSDCGIS